MLGVCLVWAPVLILFYAFQENAHFAKAICCRKWSLFFQPFCLCRLNSLYSKSLGARPDYGFGAVWAEHVFLMGMNAAAGEGMAQLLWWLHVFAFKIHGKKSPANSKTRATFWVSILETHLSLLFLIFLIVFAPTPYRCRQREMHDWFLNFNHVSVPVDYTGVKQSNKKHQLTSGLKHCKYYEGLPDLSSRHCSHFTMSDVNILLPSIISWIQGDSKNSETHLRVQDSQSFQFSSVQSQQTLIMLSWPAKN